MKGKNEGFGDWGLGGLTTDDRPPRRGGFQTRPDFKAAPY